MPPQFARLTAGLLTVLTVVSGCSRSVPGAAHTLAARDRTARTVAPADLDKLLIADKQVAEIIGAPDVVTTRTYTGITPSQGEMYSDPSCAPAIWNTMFPAYDGSGYTGAVGRWVEERGEQWTHHVDQAVVSFPSADDATRFVVRVEMLWQRCADVHLSTVEPPPAHKRLWYTIGYPKISDDISTVVDYREGHEGLAEVRAITSRSNVVIDVDTEGVGMNAEQATALVNAIAQNIRV
jgi:hypothetical protein